MDFKKPNKKKNKGAPSWMATYSDLMTLLLVLFITLFSFSIIDNNKFQMVTNSFQGLYENSPNPIDIDLPINNSGNSQGTKNNEQGNELEEGNEKLDKLLSDVQQYVDEYELGDIVTATREVRGVELVLQENVLFDSGQAVVKQQAKPFLDKVADLLKTIPNLIEVEGHTDSQKIVPPSQYVSNWNLSGDRAANVVNYFVEEHSIPSERFVIAGFADTKPIDSNENESGRMKNRRVVIVISDEDYIINELNKEEKTLSVD